MKLSTKGRYGVRLMIDIASNYNGRPIFLRDIAKRQDISEKYLWHLIDSLKIAGLLISVRGAHGGYRLAKNAEEINLNDIILATEGNIGIVECVKDPSSCERSETCATIDVWRDVSDKISETLKAISLKDMVETQKNKIDNNN